MVSLVVYVVGVRYFLWCHCLSIMCDLGVSNGVILCLLCVTEVLLKASLVVCVLSLVVYVE